MRRFALLFLALAACDHDENATTESVFAKPDALDREIIGRVRRGFEYTNGAVVQVVATPGFRTDETFVPGPSVVTDEFGLYRFTRAPLRYDLLVRFGDDTAQFQGMTYRGFEAPFADPVPPRAYGLNVALTMIPAPAAGHGVAFFAAGTGVFDVTGDLAKGLVVTADRYAIDDAAIWAVEYDGTLAHPVASGQVALKTSGAVVTTTATIHTTPVPQDDHDVVIDVDGPAGITTTPIEWGVTFTSNLSITNIGKFAVGEHLHYVYIPGARYTYRVRGTKGGAVTDSGLLDLGVVQGKGTAKLYDFPVLERAGDQFAGHTVGVREHIFQGTTKVRVITVDDAVTIPDITPVGGVVPRGKATWTVHGFPTVTTGMIGFQGFDMRVTAPNVTSAPVPVEL